MFSGGKTAIGSCRRYFLYNVSSETMNTPNWEIEELYALDTGLGSIDSPTEVGMTLQIYRFQYRNGLCKTATVST